MSKNIKYSELETTTEVGAVCPCGEYKGMVDCPECEGTPFCIYCADGCDDCGAVIDFSA